LKFMYLKVGYMSHRRKKDYRRNGGKVSLGGLKLMDRYGCYVTHIKWKWWRKTKKDDWLWCKCLLVHLHNEYSDSLRSLKFVLRICTILTFWWNLCTDLDDWLTVHRSITLVDLQLDAQNSYLFIYI
jgi:hypothetical protein